MNCKEKILSQLKEVIIEEISEMSFKPILESCDEIADAYDNDEITYHDFECILDDIVKTINNGNS